MTRRLLLATVLLVAAAGSAWAVVRDDPGRRVVLPGEAVEAAVASSPRATIVLAPGVHAPFRIVDDGVHVRAEAGAVVRGGDSGIVVDGARGVQLSGVVVEGARWHGIEVVAGTATITDCVVSGLTDPRAQGIEIRNANGMGRSRISGCTVRGGQEGIVSHVSRVEVRGNAVTGTTMRGIAVTEMSEGLVAGNAVRDVSGVGIFCGDMSHCEIRDNAVRGVVADPKNIRSLSGQGIVAWWYSTLRHAGNDLADLAAEEPIGIYHGSVTTDRFPLALWPDGWRGAIPAVGVTAIAMAALVAARALLARPSAALVRRFAAARPVPGVARLAATAFAVTAVVQCAHLSEHAVQVFQVFVAESEQRSGVVGARFDTEWLHLGFNVVVLAGVVVGAWLGRHELARRLPHVVPWLVAGAAIQTWHVVEHVARVLQYLDRGISPAPGIVGGRLGLVWFHFAINIPVTIALVVVAAAWVRADSRRVAAPAPAPVPAMAAAAG